jgi:hypothetical protein
LRFTGIAYKLIDIDEYRRLHSGIPFPESFTRKSPQSKWADNQEAVTLPWLAAHSIRTGIGGDTSMLDPREGKSSHVSKVFRPLSKIEIILANVLLRIQGTAEILA